MFARAEHQDAESPRQDVQPALDGRRGLSLERVRGREAALLALQRSAGNRVVRRVLAREPAPGVIREEMANRARAAAEIHEFERYLGHPVSEEDRVALAQALSATAGPSTHSPVEVGLTALEHPLKTAEHLGPKALVPDKLAEEDYLLGRFPHLFAELVRFFAATDATPTINVLTLFDWHFAGSPDEAYNVYKYLLAKRGEGPMPARLAVTPSMFGDEPEDIREASLLLGSFNVFAARVHVPGEAGEDGKQFRLRVTDSLGLQEGQKGAFWLLSFVVGSKDVVLAEYLGSIDAGGRVDVRPWSSDYDTVATTPGD